MTPAEWLALWGVAQATVCVFRPILEELAKDVAKDLAKDYVKSCFASVFSPLHRKPLTVATGRALKELLELIQNELLDAELDQESLRDWLDDVRRFTRHEQISAAIASRFLDPDDPLDPAVFARAWQQIESAHTLPDDFSWQRVAKRFGRKVDEIRQSSGELQETFASLAAARMSGNIGQLVGLPPGFDLDAYREALIERYGSLHFESLDTAGVYYGGVRLWNVFVPQSVRECHEYYPQLLEIPKERQRRLRERNAAGVALEDAEEQVELRRREYYTQPLRPVLEVAGDASLRRLVLLGDPGAGKSSLLRYLALEWARLDDANQRYLQPLPLLIELRDYSRWSCQGARDFARFLHEASTWHRLNQITLDRLFTTPDRVVLLLDGLDEIFDPAQREEVVNDIHRFSNQYPLVQMLVTSRVVGYKSERLHDAGFRHFMLQDLSPTQIDDFIDRWHAITFDNPADAEVKRERLRRAIRESRSIAELAGNPLLLTMMAILNRSQELPRDRVDLYQQAARVLLHQWDTERALEAYPELRGQVGLREKTEMLRKVAYAMQSGSHGLAGNIIDEEELIDLIEEYLHDALHFEQARAAAHAVVRQLRERNFILCYLGADSYAFVHRTFLEYFCAAEIVHRFNVAKSLDFDALLALYDAHCREDDWREVLRLICGQIDTSFVARIVEHLATRTDLDTWDRETPLPELPLAIWCLSEVRNTSKLVETGEILQRQLIVFITSAESHIRLKVFIKTQICKASAELGMNWPSTRIIEECAVSLVENISYIGAEAWPMFVGTIYPKRRILLILANAGHLTNCKYQPLVIAGALSALAEYFQDTETRDLLTERAVHEMLEAPRCAAMEALAEKWPDEVTRNLLYKRAVKDIHEYTRYTALKILANKWPDDGTRKLLYERAIQDKDEAPRRAALIALADNWPDETTYQLLRERAVQDTEEYLRRAALRILVDKWPDLANRKLLYERAVEDDNPTPRQSALEALAETWPDEITRKLLHERAVQDKNESPRSAALRALAMIWPDEVTHKFLCERAVKDEDRYPRQVALQMLAEKWPDKVTGDMLRERITVDDCAGSILGGLHSNFGCIIFSQDLDGVYPYINLLEPVSPKHIERAARKVGIPQEQIDETVRSLSDHMGWDITRGLPRETTGPRKTAAPK